MQRISLEELATAIDGVPATPFRRGASFDRIRLDPREVSPGDLFWAVSEEPGECREQLAQAESRGAVATVLARGDAMPRPGRIFVSNPRLALARFARWYRSLLDAFTIGIIGRLGGRTMRRVTGEALTSPAKKEPDDQDGMIPLSLALLRIAPHDHFAVLELKATAHDALVQLLEIARPEAVVVTRGAGLEPRSTWETLLQILPRGGFAVLPGDQTVMHEISRQPHAGIIPLARGEENLPHVGTETTSMKNSARWTAHEARRAGTDARPLADFFQRTTAFDWWDEIVQPGDVILVKGPRPAGRNRRLADPPRDTSTTTTTIPRAA